MHLSSSIAKLQSKENSNGSGKTLKSHCLRQAENWITGIAMFLITVLLSLCSREANHTTQFVPFRKEVVKNAQLIIVPVAHSSHLASERFLWERHHPVPERWGSLV